MKTIIILLAAVILLTLGGIAMAQTTQFGASMQATASGKKTADAVILNRPGWVRGVIISADGTNACTVDLYNSATAASGTVLMTHTAGAGTADTVGQFPPFAIAASNGIYADMTLGAGACTFEVYYWE